MKKTARTVFPALAATLLVAATVGAASPAVALEDDESVVISSPAVVTAGETAYAEAGGYVTSASLDEPHLVSAMEVTGDAGLSKSQKSAILGAMAAAAVYSNHWSQFTTGGAYTQTQNGTFYYNGSRVWVTQSYSGYVGSQACFTNYVVAGWGISNISKSDTGGTSSRSLYCGWNVTQPVLITTYASMTATVNASGSISGFGATVG